VTASPVDRDATTPRPFASKQRIAVALELARLPQVTIEMCGDARCHEFYRYFTKRHPRFRLIQNKAWGVALIRLPDTSEGFAQNLRKHARRHVKKAVAAGYTFAPLDALARLDEVMAINRSLEERQGRAMSREYFDEVAVRQYHEQSGETYGVFDRLGILRAYADIRVCGQVVVLNRVLGHGDAMGDGVMYLLLTAMVRLTIERRGSNESPIWFMYDTFPGASAGLRQFKYAIGLEPYRVRWRWRT
jgi:hypothetical protein